MPTTLCGIALGLVTCLAIGRLASPRCGLVAGLATVTSCLFAEQARMVGFDMPMSLGVGVATLAAIRNLAKEESDAGWWLTGHAGLLFGFLAKGLPAVAMYGVGLLAAAIALRQLRLLLRWQHLIAVAFFVAGAAVYLALAIHDGGHLVLTQQLVEILHRGTRWGLGALLNTLLKPLVSLTAFLPASMLLVLLFVRRATEDSPPLLTRVRRAAWAFLLSGTVLLMLSPVRNTRYLLPLATSLAVLAGLYAESFRFPLPAASRINPARWIKTLADPAAWMVLAGCIYWVIFVTAVEPRRAGKDSQRDVAARFAPYVGPNETVYIASQLDNEDSNSSLFWYLGRPLEVWHVGGSAPPVHAWVVVPEERGTLAAASHAKELLTVTEAKDHEGHRYLLCRVEQ